MIEAIQFYSAIRLTGGRPWRTKGEPAPLPLLVSMIIRVGVGFGLAWAAADSSQVTGAFGAIAVGVATPLLIEQMAKNVPVGRAQPTGRFGHDLISALGRRGPAFLPQDQPDAARPSQIDAAASADVATPLMSRRVALAAVRAGQTLAGANLAGTKLTRANLAGATVTDANLAGTKLIGTNLTRANLAGTNLARANLARANLARANLIGTNLARANLARANLARANLTRANLTDTVLGNARWDEQTRWPSPSYKDAVRSNSDRQSDGTFRIRSGGKR
jgi:hypothetical protein